MKHLLLSFFTLFIFSLAAQIDVTYTGPMTDFRNGHAASALEDGRVLVTGGFNGTQNLSSAELYDPMAFGWVATVPMLEVRYTHTSTALNNGQVLITGGWDGAATNHASTELFDPQMEEFTSGPALPIGRSDHRATKLSDGRVIITGGFTGSVNTNSCAIYDPEDNSITSSAPMAYGRSSHTATLLPDGRVLVCGGFNPDFGFQMTQCEIWDPQTDSWTNVADLQTPRDSHGATLTPDGQVIIIGGRYFNGITGFYEGLASTEVYDLISDTWSDGPPLVAGHSYVEPITFSSPEVIVLPGGTFDSGIGTELSFSWSELWSAETGDWEDISLNTEGRYRYAVARISENMALVAGGNNGDFGTAELYSYNDVSVAEQVQKAIRLFPNPAYDNVDVFADHPFHEVRILDLNGRLIEQNELSAVVRHRLSVGNLSPGYYILEILTEKGPFRLTFVKE